MTRARAPKLLLPLLLALSPGCGLQRHAAESAVIDVVGDYALMRHEVANVAPEEANDIEEAINDAKRSLDQGDLERTLLTTRELRLRLRTLSERLPARRAALDSTWQDLRATVPVTLVSLQNRLRLANRPPHGPRAESFDAARRELPGLMDDWRECRTALESGWLAEAVSRAERLRGRTFRLIAEIEGDS